SFSEYVALDNNNLPQGRYIKLKADLSSNNLVPQEIKDLLFNQEDEENILTLNKFVEAISQLQLKNDYNYIFEKNNEWLDSRSLHTKKIIKSEWKTINSIRMLKK